MPTIIQIERDSGIRHAQTSADEVHLRAIKFSRESFRPILRLPSLLAQSSETVISIGGLRQCFTEEAHFINGKPAAPLRAGYAVSSFLPVFTFDGRPRSHHSMTHNASASQIDHFLDRDH